nr:hypothetical protein [Tanacetum cinerariifolium]
MSYRDYEIVVLKSKLEKISKAKDDLETKIEKFKNASQSLNKLIGSQITDNSKKGLEYVSYKAVPPPHTRRFLPPRFDFVKISAPVKENNEAPLIKDRESNEEDEVESPPDKKIKTVEPSMDKVEVEIPKQNDKPARRPVKYAETYRTQRPKDNQRNWNNLKSHQLDYCIMKEGMSTLRGRKSVPGMNSSEREMERGVNTPRCDEDSLELKELMVFMASATIKKVNDVVQLHALIDKKKVVVTEDVIRQDLRLDDADGVKCFPNEVIFAELACMGYEKPPPKLTAKRTTWNEFSCSMAYAVICLATGLNPPLILLWVLRRTHPNRGKIAEINVDKDVTLVDVKTQEEVAYMDAELQGRITQEDVSVATKDVNVAEPTVFDNKEVIMTMAQTLIKMKAKNAKLLNEQIAKRLHDEEVEKVIAREKQEKDDLERAQKFKKAKKERDDLKLTLEKFQTSSKNLSKLLESQVSDKTGLGHDSQVFNSQVFDYKELNSYESDDSVPTSPVNDRYKTAEGYHAVPPPYNGTFMLPKPNLVFNDAHNASESLANVVNFKSSSNKPSKDMSKILRPDAPIIEDWISNSKDETKIKPVSIAVPQTTVKSPRPVKYVVNKAHSPIRRPITHRPATKNSNFNQKVATVKVTKGYKKVKTAFKPDKDVEEPKKKRVAKETLFQESFKKLKAVEVSGSESTQETPSNDCKEMSEEDVQNMLEIVPVSEFKVEALQVKYPLIDWEIHSKGSRSYWKIIRVSGITEAYQSFEDMLKGFDREDLVDL